MSTHTVLPAVLMSLAASGSLSVPAPAAATGAPVTSPSAMPIVALFTATNEAEVPQRLDEWANQLALRTGYSKQGGTSDLYLPRCGTISGSSGGWDDSKQDCCA